MRPDTYQHRYQPTSPLSPKLSSGGNASVTISPVRHRSPQPFQTSRGFRLDLPSFPGHPSRGQAASPSTRPKSPAIHLRRGTQPTPMESPRLMREKQKELIARAQLSSKLAASPMAARPGAPRLDPLGSPKGAVTPLTLEEQEVADYFAAAVVERFSPVASPSAHSHHSSMSGKDEKMFNKHKVEAYP